MAKDQQVSTNFTFKHICYFLLLLSSFSTISFFYWSRYSSQCNAHDQTSQADHTDQIINLLSYPLAWNHLNFSGDLPGKLLKIAVFVKKWPSKDHAGGMERHAMTLNLGLAKRGHELHIFTTSPPNSSFPTYPFPNLKFHLSEPSPAGHLDQARAWALFQTQNGTGKPFDIVHSESVALLHTRARTVAPMVASWHGIAYETIDSDIAQELLRPPDKHPSPALATRAGRVVDEVRFFTRYAHHVATSDHAGDVLRRAYMLPTSRVHVILNGVDEAVFFPNNKGGEAFRRGLELSPEAIVIGMAGRLVKDKGHPIMFEALKQIFDEDEAVKHRLFVLVAGDGPWASRYKALAPNLIVLGPLEQTQLAFFYNAIDIFANPTLRAQGLDHTLLEAMLSGKPVMATGFKSITESVVVGTELGYTFSPTVESVKEAVYKVVGDGRVVLLEKKGKAARERGLKLFTAAKMVAAYERLFLCMSENKNQNQNAKFRSLTNHVGDSPEYCIYRP